MAYYGYSNSTSTATNITTSSSSDLYWMTEGRRAVKKKKTVANETFHWKKKRLMKPFNPAKGVKLLTQLQADFDSLCREQMKVIRDVVPT